MRRDALNKLTRLLIIVMTPLSLLLFKKHWSKLIIMGNLCASPDTLLQQFKHKPIGEEVKNFSALETRLNTPIPTHTGTEKGTNKKKTLKGFEYSSQKFIAIRA